MALGTNHMGGGVGGSLTVDIPLIFGQKINDYFRYNLTLASFFTDRSDELADGGSTIYTPNIVALSTNAKTNGSAVTLNNPIQTTQTLAVSTWKEASFLIEDREMAQLKKSYYLQDKLAKGGAWEVAQDLEDAIAALFSGFTGNTAVGISSANVADSSLLAAIATLETLGTPGIYTGDVAWIFHPNTFYRQIGSVDKLTLWQNTNTELPRTKAPTRSLYSIPVIVSPAVPIATSGNFNNARVNLLAHKDAIHFAKMSMPVKADKGMIGTEGVRVQQSYIHEYMGELVTIDMCYGVVENRDGAAVVILGKQVAVGLSDEVVD
jgi:hypothetical protein